jgi:hypothetical protein
MDICPRVRAARPPNAPPRKGTGRRGRLLAGFLLMPAAHLDDGRNSTSAGRPVSARATLPFKGPSPRSKRRAATSSASPDCRILAIRKHARWPALPTDLEHSRATGRRPERPRGRRDRSRRKRAVASRPDDNNSQDSVNSCHRDESWWHPGMSSPPNPGAAALARTSARDRSAETPAFELVDRILQQRLPVVAPRLDAPLACQSTSSSGTRRVGICSFGSTATAPPDTAGR